MSRMPADFHNSIVNSISAAKNELLMFMYFGPGGLRAPCVLAERLEIPQEHSSLAGNKAKSLWFLVVYLFRNKIHKH